MSRLQSFTKIKGVDLFGIDQKGNSVMLNVRGRGRAG